MYGKNARKFVNDTSGAVLLYVAFMSTVVLGIAGLAIDTGHWYASQRAAQGAADAAAVAAARELAWSDDIADLTAAANELALMNGFEAAAVTVNHPPLNGPSAGNSGAVEVIVQQPTPGFFSTLFLGDGGVEVSARSVAGSVGGAPACLIALEPTERYGLLLTGGSSIVADGCMLQINSANEKAMKLGGSGAGITADVTAVVGDIEAGAELISPEAQISAPAMADPLASLAPPPYDSSTCDETNYLTGSSATVTLNPGVYCGGIKVESGADVTFNPGIYIIKDGQLLAKSGSMMTGDGVGFYFTGDDATFELTGGASAHFSAPTSGPMAGVIFYADPVTAPNDEKSASVVGGGGDTVFEGTLYFPNQDIDYTGGSTATIPAPYTMIIARKFLFGGGGVLTLGSDYASSDVPLPPAMGGSAIAILE